MSHYELTDPALQDMNEIANYIAEDNVEAAVSLMVALRQRCAALSQHPGMGRIRKQIGKNVRSVTEGNYVIFYRVQSSHLIQILRIIHAKRDLGKVVFVDLE